MRTHLCGQITTVEIGHSVTLSGWVASRRDHGGIIFIDLRDRSGQIQVVADPEMTASFVHLEAVRNEFVLRVTGQVQARPEGTVNESSPTGEIEIVANQIDLLNQAKPLPFQLEEQEIGEQTRLKYRFLDLRRPAMQDLLRLRHKVISRLRAFLNEHEFIDIETPMLTRSTPEGARDYLVPSRTQLGAFFALPQSPQLFKQLLMVAGFERYYQIARCFRDEDLRADRQPEFTQLDVEMSFVDEFEVMNLMEEMVRSLFKSILNIDLVHPVPRMTYAEAVSRFGVDRPDLRIPLELTELTDVMREVEFKVFSGPAQDPSGRVVAMRIPDGNRLSRAQIDQYTEQVKQLGAKGLAYIKVHQISGAREELHSPILKFLSDSVLDQILIRTRAEPGDLIVFGADKATIVNHAMGALRIQIGHDLELVDDGWELLWVTDFPLVEWSEENRRWQALHHPFTSPKPEQVDLLDNDPGRVLSRAYDLILNGTEIGGGSIRIHKDELQRKIFQVLGIGEREAAEKFGFLLEALNYGAPPHGGIAFGVDRLVAMMGGVESIRDVIAFPKTQKASCLLTEAPNRVSDLQLRDLGLQLKSV